MRNLPKARVARLVECHIEQKAGYNQHTSPHQNPPSFDGTIPQFIMYCQKQAMAEATIRTKYKILRVMLRNNVNLSNPEEVKLFIARNKNWSNGHKISAVYAYNDYAKMLGIKWEIPYYKKNETLPFVPTEKEIDALIAGTSKKVSITLQALKETGFRIGELWNCKNISKANSKAKRPTKNKRLHI